MKKVGESDGGSLSTLCPLLGYSRQAYYQRRSSVEKEIFEGELLIQEVLRIRKKQPRIGTRKLLVKMEEYMHGHNIRMGRDAFFGLLRANRMLVRKRRAGKPRTTLSHAWMRRFPNLIRGFIPTGPNQLWVSDITYVRIRSGFGYLSLITDAYSRKIVGFHLSRDLRAAGCIKALKMALKNNPEKNNPDRDWLVHHSDRGLQYHSGEYLRLLGPRTSVSMSENSDPLENAIAERVNGILKDELLDAHFDSFAQAQSEIAMAVSIYNHLRPHSSVDMLTPAIAHTRTGELKRRWKNYYRPKTTQEASHAAV